MTTSAVLSFNLFPEFRKRRNSYLAICTLVVDYIALVCCQVLIEIQREKFQETGFGYIIWGLEYDGFLPCKTCDDTDPVRSWTNTTDVTSVSIGCETKLLSAPVAAICIFIMFSPILLEIYSRSALILSFTNISIFLIGSLSVGCSYRAFLPAAALQLSAGFIAFRICEYQGISSREEESLSDATLDLWQSSRNILHSLIPANILEKIGSESSSNMICAEIQHCTIMFCMLEKAAELQDSFTEEVLQLLNSMFCDFDDAVERHEMFKYQHGEVIFQSLRLSFPTYSVQVLCAVGDWYIVACPSAAAQSSSHLQAAANDEYPEAYTRSMVMLAAELQAISLSYRLQDGNGLLLKVGINCGVATGAVIGLHKRFYCLYGDVVNTAARMCKYANDKIHCSAAFAASVLALGEEEPRICCTSRGSLEIKGKGLMETFDLSVLDGPDHGVSFRPGYTCFSHSTVSDLGMSDGVQSNKAWLPWREKSKIYGFTDLGTHTPAELESNSSHSCKIVQVQHKLPRDPKYTLDALKATFKDVIIENEFLVAQVYVRRRELLAGLLLHIVAILLQLHQVHFPEYEYDFMDLGPIGEQISESMAKVRLILDVHAVLALSYCIFLIFSILQLKSYIFSWDLHVLVLSLSFVATSFLACSQLPALWGWLIGFPSAIVILSAWISRMNFRYASLQALCTFVAACLAMRLIRNFSPIVAVDLLFLLVFSLAGSGIANIQQRRLWRSQAAHSAEVDRFRKVLFDLLPPEIAERMLEAGIEGNVPSKRMLAAVLQLDICNFTTMSQIMCPMEVATMMHRLSEFSH